MSLELWPPPLMESRWRMVVVDTVLVVSSRMAAGVFLFVLHRVSAARASASLPWHRLPEHRDMSVTPSRRQFVRTGECGAAVRTGVADDGEAPVRVVNDGHDDVVLCEDVHSSLPHAVVHPLFRILSTLLANTRGANSPVVCREANRRRTIGVRSWQQRQI